MEEKKIINSKQARDLLVEFIDSQVEALSLAIMQASDIQDDLSKAKHNNNFN